MKCRNLGCLHNEHGECTTECTINAVSKCETFEKGPMYYLTLALNEMGESNFLDFVKINMDFDMRISISYIMRVYGVIYSEREWGTCRLLTFHKAENEPPLKASEIMDLPINSEEVAKIIFEVKTGDIPKPNQEKPKKESQPFGWLSPTGEFTEGDFGDHEEVAQQIVYEKHFEKEFTSWCEGSEQISYLRRDFLSEVKGYALIHNPMGDGGYIVSHQKPLTKKQKEFLYGYFSDMGDSFKAEQYLDD